MSISILLLTGDPILKYRWVNYASSVENSQPMSMHPIEEKFYNMLDTIILYIH